MLTFISFAKKRMSHMESKSWCVNPYVNLSVQPNGTTKACCMSTLEFTTDDNKKFLNQDSILNFWNSNSRKKMISDLSNGIQIPECSACWKEESAGKDSKRIRDNKLYKDRIVDNNTLPIVMDLSMGNLCNIKCRICSPRHSTPWLVEQAKVSNPDNPKEYIHLKQWDTFKESFDYTNDYFWNDIEQLLPNVEKFDFAGGEPFYIEKHWDIVKKCVDNGWSKSQHIHYNTNGTIFPEKYMHLLEEFKIVDIQISSDGVGDKFEFMRHPAKWDAVESNIDKFIKARDASSAQWYLSACISISAFNVYDFFETFEHYAAKGIGIYINIVHDHRGTRILPDALKKIVIDKLKSCESKYLPRQWIEERDMICKHLENSQYNEHDWLEWLKEIAVRDKLRNESYAKTFSEFYKHIEGLHVER